MPTQHCVGIFVCVQPGGPVMGFALFQLAMGLAHALQATDVRISVSTAWRQVASVLIRRWMNAVPASRSVRLMYSSA